MCLGFATGQFGGMVYGLLVSFDKGLTNLDKYGKCKKNKLSYEKCSIPPVIQTSLNFPVYNFRFLDSGRT